MIRLTLLSLSLVACNSFDAQESAKEPTNSSYKIIDASDTINVDPQRNDFATPSSVVMTIPELGLEVIEQEDQDVEVQPDSEHPGMLDYEEQSQPEESKQEGVDDDYVKILEVQSLPSESSLTAELFAKRTQRIVALCSFPDSTLKESQTEHSIKILLPEQESLYTSEILESIVLAVENDATLIYLPLTAESMPDIVFKAIDYAQTEGVNVFDAKGERL